jgi:hypothetical protein
MKAAGKTIDLVGMTIAGAGRQGISPSTNLQADTRLGHASGSEHACATRVNDPQFVLHRF